ncbi:hypothetical protein BU26DRAFT_436278 [Trematosphaeria pertusa]|uniref:Uncharacterized protein n=1 Tax=Trematosphaeria pertusa TaxID=390896 RepID=A0A6A6I1R3_9PLEO|nr:uncharacterized protein BU26DRAFT_436278 [Trematosphaeria pertusa]KAF2243948.1 hypothetical protein BU26DRAFT_436278 [Trematosphaeria pertusa]
MTAADTSFSRTKLPNSMTTSTTSSHPNSTISSATSTTTKDITPQLFPGANQPDPARMRNESVFNYYFLFLAVFGVAVAVFLWWLHRRRKRRKEQMRLSGQNALARDLDGWINTRRWFHGAWRHNQTTAFVRREEGLNEHGEAPPPYQPKSDVTAAHDGIAQDPATRLAIPLRTLSRDEIEQSRPPEYRETISRGGPSSTRPDTATTRTTRPDTADVQSGSST